MRALHLRPIVGLVHHGSGPSHTHLAHASFPTELAAYAAAVAQRYPWINDYTPINEPLTTARFSGLYGHWYPHGRSNALFARTLVQQSRATVLAMQAIRRYNPTAQLVQTEDFGKTFATPALSYQAAFENERRWLSLDLLFGRVTPDHRLYRYLIDAGITAAELQFFCAQPCPPDIIGINYYLSSDRFLDDHLATYPRALHGSNGRDAYADVEAVRVCTVSPVSHARVLRDVWERYGVPMVVTEVHNGCTRDEQMRWLDEAWRAAREARDAGIDVRAVTAWAAFGSFNWHNLVTVDTGYYEPGLFDVSHGSPRRTALAQMTRSLARTGDCAHPLLSQPGWWRKPSRLTYPRLPTGDRLAPICGAYGSHDGNLPVHAV